MNKAVYASVILGGLACSARGHDSPEHGLPGNDDLHAPDFFLVQGPATSRRIEAPRVSISVDGDTRVVKANGLPDHTPGQFPRQGNPNRISPQDYTFKIPVKPQVAERPTPNRGAFFAVALNGVPFEPGTAEFWDRDPRSGWVYEAKSRFIDLGLDQHDAHVQPTGAYHYHGLPNGLVERRGGTENKMLLVGYAADGFPLYTSWGLADPKDAGSAVRKLKSSWRLKSGTRPNGPGGKYDGRFTEDYEYVAGSGDLDECNGRWSVSPEYPEGIYQYYITDEFPYLARQWRGTPDASFRKSGPGPGFGPPGGGERRGPGNRPPFPPGGPPPRRDAIVVPTEVWRGSGKDEAG